jgi:pimeloyl-ACP methyl ester carboxylesterase
MLTEKSFDTGSLTINYAEGPENGEPLVLLHGGTARWQELTPLISELENNWHLFACDLRGHGKSGRATSYRAIDFFPDTIALIKNRIGSPTVLLGHSGGAIAALGTAAQIPELIRAAVVLDPPIFLRELSIKSNGVYGYFTGVYDILTRQRTTRAVFSELIPGIDETGIKHFEEMLSTVDPEVVRTILDDLYFDDLDVQWMLIKVICPTLFLYGEIEKGGVVRDRDVEFFLTHTPNGQAVQIKDAGHLLQWEQPERVLELIAHWNENLK